MNEVADTIATSMLIAADGVGNAETPPVTYNSTTVNPVMKPFAQASAPGNEGIYEAQTTITPERQQQNVDWVKNQGNAIFNSYNRARLDPNYWRNQVQDAPRGQMNQLNYDDTIQRSRAADYLNNRYVYQGADIGVRSALNGYSAPVGVGKGVQQAPLVTEETRQMEIARGLEQEMRKRGIQRAEDVQDYYQDLQKAGDMLTRAIVQQTGISNVEFDNAVRNAVLQVKYTEPYSLYLTNVARQVLDQLLINNKSDVLMRAGDIFKDNPALAQRFMESTIGGNYLTMEDAITSPVYAKLVNSGMSAEEAYKTMVGLQTYIGAISAKVGYLGLADAMFRQGPMGPGIGERK